ncbi:MAG: DUF89 family protein, partial [Chlorobi bacterium]|nr:DUF89 family protein [Chlorobiota bacterium]
MKTYLDCIPCFMRQTLSAARLATTDNKAIKKLLEHTGKMIEEIPMQNTPAQAGAFIYSNIREVTGVEDPYKKVKEESIEHAKSMLPVLYKLIDNSENKLLTAIRIAIAGNVVDFGMDKEFDLAKDLKKILIQDFAIFDYKLFEQQLSSAKNILYLADNAGESVFDKVLIQQLKKPVTYVVRETPIINDVTIEDAVASGIDSV